MSLYALTVTVHDAEGRIFEESKNHLATISGLYSQKVANCTRATDKRMLWSLQKSNFNVVFSPAEKQIGTSRRNALETLLKQESANFLMYCDFDRLVHWIKNYKEELETILKTDLSFPYIALGRTKRAWQTHPTAMVEIEKPENQTLAQVFSLSDDIDFTAGSCLMTREAAEIILKYSVEPTNATDLEWPAIIYRYLHIIPQCILTEGLEFETADYYKEEIKQVGSKEAWTKSVYENPEQIKARQKLAQDSIASAKRILNT